MYKNSRIIYRFWLADRGYESGQVPIYVDPIRPNYRIIHEVRGAIEKLSASEREFIHRYYYRGQTEREIARALDIKISRVEMFHRRTLNRLKKILSGFARSQFDISVDTHENCPICSSPFRDEIDSLIEGKDERETWSRIIRILKIKYKIVIRTPQVLIGHWKYH